MLLRRIIATLILLLGLASLSAAQSDVPQKAQYPGLVAVHFIQGGVGNIGSGMIVAADGTTAEVLTCAHGYTPQSSVLVITQDGRRWQGTMKGIDATQDVALVTIKDPGGIKPVTIAETEPEINSNVYVCGYAKGTVWRGSWSRVIGWVGPTSGSVTWMQFSGGAQQGMSGGPILNQQGKIVGIVTTTTGYVSHGPCFPRARAVLRFVLPPYRRPPIRVGPLVLVQPPAGQFVQGPRRPGSDEIPMTIDGGQGPGCAPGRPCPSPPFDQPPPPAADGGQSVPLPPPAVDPALIDQLARQAARIDALEKQLALVQATAGPPGAPGKDGAAGPAGPTGPPGMPAALDSLPPIRIQTLNPDGTVHQDAQARLGDLIRLKPIAVKAEVK